MTASKAELWTQLSKAIKIADENFKYAGQNSTNFLSLVDSLQQAYEGDHIGNTNAALASLRSQFNSICANTDLLNSIILELAKVGYNSIATVAATALDDISKGMKLATETISSRAWTYGAVANDALNVGTGTVYRLTTDKNGNTIEVGAFPGGVTKIEIITDKNTGATSGAESAKIYGYGRTPTDSINLGSAPSGETTISAKKASDGILANGNFSSYDDSGTDVSVTSWTFGTATKATHVNIDTAIYFRNIDPSTTGKSVKLLLDNTMTQYLLNASSRINPDLPVFFIVRYYRNSNCDGTLTITLGSKSTNVTLTTVLNATWLDLVLGVSNSDGWYDNYKSDTNKLGVKIEIALSSRTTGTLDIGEVILAQPTYYDGKYYLLTAGATDFLKGDNFTFTDSVSNTGRIQTTLARLYRKHLPHTSGTPTYADA